MSESTQIILRLMALTYLGRTCGYYASNLHLNFLCSPLETTMYVRDVPWDCSSYVICISGLAVPASCPVGKLYSSAQIDDKCGPAAEVNSSRCVGSIWQYIREICRHNPLATVPDSGQCAHYFDCSVSDGGSQYMEYLLECPYPSLYSTHTGSCKDYRFVSCEERFDPRSPCEYHQYLQKYNCSDPSCAECNRHHPSCVGLANGYHPIPHRDDLLVICHDQRTMSIIPAPPKSTGPETAVKPAGDRPSFRVSSTTMESPGVRPACPSSCIGPPNESPSTAARGTTESPISAVEPTITESPTSAVEPTVTESLTSAVEPTVTESPISAVEPTITESPTSAVEPTVTESHISAVEPTITESLTSAVEPTVTESPISAVEPTITESPTSAVEPTITESLTSAVEPTVTESPISAVEPTITESPTSAVEPTITESLTSAVEPTVTESPISAVEPTITESPTSAVEPTITDSPTSAVEPTVTESPTSAVEPTITESPISAVEPTITERPTSAVEPTVTESPTSAVEPTVTESPTSAVEPTVTESPTSNIDLGAPSPSWDIELTTISISNIGLTDTSPSSTVKPTSATSPSSVAGATITATPSLEESTSPVLIVEE